MQHDLYDSSKELVYLLIDLAISSDDVQVVTKKDSKYICVNFGEQIALFIELIANEIAPSTDGDDYELLIQKPTIEQIIKKYSDYLDVLSRLLGFFSESLYTYSRRDRVKIRTIDELIETTKLTKDYSLGLDIHRIYSVNLYVNEINQLVRMMINFIRSLLIDKEKIKLTNLSFRIGHEYSLINEMLISMWLGAKIHIIIESIVLCEDNRKILERFSSHPIVVEFWKSGQAKSHMFFHNYQVLMRRIEVENRTISNKFRLKLLGIKSRL